MARCDNLRSRVKLREKLYYPLLSNRKLPEILGKAWKLEVIKSVNFIRIR